MESFLLTHSPAERVKRGYPLLTKKDFTKGAAFEEGKIIDCLDQQRQFVARAYLGKQHKGDGWVLTFDPKESIDQHFFEVRFRRAEKVREFLQKDEQTTAYRLFNGEGDGIGGVTIDRYGDFCVFSWYSQGIYLHREVIMKAFQAVIPDIKGIYQKIRFDQKAEPESVHIAGETAPEPLVIRENGIHYAVYLNEGLMTGIFLDQREIRGRLLETYAMGKTVLNTFSYTGAFSVAAAMGGSVQTTSVDLAKRSLAKTGEQFEVNSLDPDQHRIHVMDVFDYIRYALRKALVFDVVIADPPSFSRSGKRTFSVSRDYTELLCELIDLTKPGGILIASMNAAAVSRQRMEQFIQDAFSIRQESYEIEESYSLPEDFRVHPHYQASDYLKVFIIRKGS